MSEHLHPKHEHKAESLNLDAETRKNHERILKEAEHAETDNPSIENLQAKVEHEAISAHETTIGEHEQPKPDSPIGLQRELKSDAYKRTLQKIRKDLPKSDRVLSRMIHQPQVETISNIGSKTLARPSGIIGGGLVSLIGSSTLLYMAKYYGFRYNFFVFFLLFIGGFAVGTLLELVLRLVIPRRRHRV